MKINFRQGLISYQQSGSQAVFLLPGIVPNTVSLSVSPKPTIATIAHGSSDYLLKFDETVLNAWQLTAGIDNWLFIDQDLINGALTYGVTTHEPITSLITPVAPAARQLWFDLNSMVMKTFTGVKWIITPRLVVGKVQNGNTNQIQSYPVGSSVGLSIPGSPGFLMLDSQLRPLRTSAGELLTSDSPVRIKTTVGTSGVLSEPVNSFIPVRANQAIPAMSLVYFDGEDSVSLASSNPALVDPKTPIGVIEHALAMNEVGVITQQGEITYDQWNWSAVQFGKPLYCGYNGELTTTRPQGVQVYRVAYIKNAHTILFYIDSETQAQVYSAAGSIITGSPPIMAVTTTNGVGEIITTISMPAATPSVNGYMTAVQADQLGTFNSRITTNETSITTLQTSKANIVHTHVITDVSNLQPSLDALTASIALKIPKVTGTTGNFPSINSDGTLLDSGFTYASFSPTGHAHTIADVTNLQSDLNGKAALVHLHEIADVNGLQTNLDGRAFINHTHAMSAVSGLDVALAGKASVSHVHAIADIPDLQSQLDQRSLVGHLHPISEIVNLQTTLNSKSPTVHAHNAVDVVGGAVGQVLTSNGSIGTWQDVPASGSVAPLNEIVFGTGAGTSSDSHFRYFTSINSLYVNVPNVSNEDAEVIIRSGDNLTGWGHSELQLTTAPAGRPSDASLRGGVNTGASGRGGGASLMGGNSTNGSGGAIGIYAGQGKTSGGQIDIYAGPGGSAGGIGNGGDVVVAAGNTQHITSVGGTLTLSSGNARSDALDGHVIITTGYTTRLEIDGLGSFAVNGSVGTVGQVLTSQGAGTPTAWVTPAASGPSLPSTTLTF